MVTVSHPVSHKIQLSARHGTPDDCLPQSGQ